MSPLPEPLFDYHRNRAGRHRARRAITPEQEAETNRLVRAKVQYMMKVIISMFPYVSFDENLLANVCVKIIIMEMTLKVLLLYFIIIIITRSISTNYFSVYILHRSIQTSSN